MSVDTIDSVEALTPAVDRLVLEQVAPNLVERVAPEIMDLIEKACEYSGNRFQPAAVIDACAGKIPGRVWYMWLVFNPERARNGDFAGSVKTLAVSSIAQYPTGLRCAEIILVAGRGPAVDWASHVQEIAQWAKTNGCHRIQFIGRRGFQRALKEDWKVAATMFELNLEEDDGKSEQRH